MVMQLNFLNGIKTKILSICVKQVHNGHSLICHNCVPVFFVFLSLIFFGGFFVVVAVSVIS